MIRFEAGQLWIKHVKDPALNQWHDSEPYIIFLISQHKNYEGIWNCIMCWPGEIYPPEIRYCDTNLTISRYHLRNNAKFWYESNMEHLFLSGVIRNESK